MAILPDVLGYHDHFDYSRPFFCRTWFFVEGGMEGNRTEGGQAPDRIDFHNRLGLALLVHLGLDLLEQQGLPFLTAPCRGVRSLRCLDVDRGTV